MFNFCCFCCFFALEVLFIDLLIVCLFDVILYFCLFFYWGGDLFLFVCVLFVICCFCLFVCCFFFVVFWCFYCLLLFVILFIVFLLFFVCLFFVVFFGVWSLNDCYILLLAT